MENNEAKYGRTGWLAICANCHKWVYEYQVGTTLGFESANGSDFCNITSDQSHVEMLDTRRYDELQNELS